MKLHLLGSRIAAKNGSDSGNAIPLLLLPVDVRERVSERERGQKLQRLNLGGEKERRGAKGGDGEIQDIQLLLSLPG